MTKPALLFLAHRIPYPPNKGDKIRSFNLLKALAKDYRIFLGAFVDDRHDWQYESELRKYCTEVMLLGLDNKQKYRAFTAFFRNEALSLPYYRNSRLQSWVQDKISRESISRVFVYSSVMAQNVQGSDFEKLHRVIDFVDVDSEKWREYSQRRRWPMNWLYQREAEKLLEFDRSIAKEFDAGLFVSSHEAAVFEELAPESKSHIGFINNGVDSSYFDPELDYENHYTGSSKVMVFTGAMDYWANIDAVTWFAEKVFPVILKNVPEARFYIVGARPSDKVKKLSNYDNVHVTGAVKDIRPYLANAALAVAPMRIARGVQNKVLEAMAMAKPVIATAAAMEGITQLKDLPVCNDSGTFAQACINLLVSGDALELGAKGRQLVLKEFNWDQNLVKLESMLGDKESSLVSDTIQGDSSASNGVGEVAL